jgi:hypothetical protein
MSRALVLRQGWSPGRCGCWLGTLPRARVRTSRVACPAMSMSVGSSSARDRSASRRAGRPNRRLTGSRGSAVQFAVGAEQAERLQVALREDLRGAILESEEFVALLVAALDMEVAVPMKAELTSISAFSSAARYPSVRARLHHTCAGPPMTATRRCPSSRRWRVAAKPPVQFADPLAGGSCVGSAAASMTMQETCEPPTVGVGTGPGRRRPG